MDRQDRDRQHRSRTISNPLGCRVWRRRMKGGFVDTTRGAAVGMDGQLVEARAICAICGSGNQATGFLMTHGIVIHLCHVHHGINYLRRDGGRAFTRKLTQLWAAHGILTSRRRAALAAHVKRIQRTLISGEFPGSYAWKSQRAYAEQRFSIGTPLAAVIREVRDSGRWGGHPPSVRTITRWLAEARWLTPPRRHHPTKLALTDAVATFNRGRHAFWHTDDATSREYRRIQFILHQHDAGG